MWMKTRLQLRVGKLEPTYTQWATRRSLNLLRLIKGELGSRQGNLCQVSPLLMMYRGLPLSREHPLQQRAKRPMSMISREHQRLQWIKSLRPSSNLTDLPPLLVNHPRQLIKQHRPLVKPTPLLVVPRPQLEHSPQVQVPHNIVHQLHSLCPSMSRPQYRETLPRV